MNDGVLGLGDEEDDEDDLESRLGGLDIGMFVGNVPRVDVISYRDAHWKARRRTKTSGPLSHPLNETSSLWPYAILTASLRSSYSPARRSRRCTSLHGGKLLRMRTRKVPAPHSAHRRGMARGQL